MAIDGRSGDVVSRPYVVTRRGSRGGHPGGRSAAASQRTRQTHKNAIEYMFMLSVHVFRPCLTLRRPCCAKCYCYLNFPRPLGMLCTQFKCKCTPKLVMQLHTAIGVACRFISRSGQLSRAVRWQLTKT